MSDAVFVVEGDVARPTGWATGPWNPSLMHGGAPSALVAWAAEQIETPAPMRISRMTVDLLRPVPVAELSIEREVVRQGRKIQLCQIRLLHQGMEVVRASVLKVRTAELELPTGPILPKLDAPAPAACPVPDRGDVGSNTFWLNFDHRPVHGEFDEPGPAAAWFRQHRALVAGAPLSPAMRAAAVADFTNGLASVLPFDRWTFINADLSVSLAREPRGEWILSQGESWVAEDGVGVAMTRLSDLHGCFGTAVQTLVVESR